MTSSESSFKKEGSESPSSLGLNTKEPAQIMNVNVGFFESLSPQQNEQRPSNYLRNLRKDGQKVYIIGFSGGDCAGKKEFLKYLFKTNHDEEYYSWSIKNSGESVALLHQNYFFKEDTGDKFTSAGTDWELFEAKVLALASGEEVTITDMDKKSGKVKQFKVKPATIICIEGSHVFCHESSVQKMMNLTIFIDSEDDVRLSRRIYKDTIENGMNLDKSIERYLSKIKTSYEKEIAPIKHNSDVIISHLGDGYCDHKYSEDKEADGDINKSIEVLLALIKAKILELQEKELQEMKKLNKELEVLQELNNFELEKEGNDDENEGGKQKREESEIKKEREEEE